jgi:RNA polymerase sigma-70 factor (ECF subfamily)
MDFEPIYNEYYPKVFRLCMGYLNDEDGAADIAQETFISVWKHLPGFRGQSSIGTWIFRIATNHCLRYVATEQRRATRPDLPLQMPEGPVPDTEERLQLLYRCIARLKESERIIISLVLEGLPYSEIAAITEISEGAIRVKVHRIKSALAQQIKSHGLIQ